MNWFRVLMALAATASVVTVTFAMTQKTARGWISFAVSAALWTLVAGLS